jgi:hypothetical protein
MPELIVTPESREASPSGGTCFGTSRMSGRGRSYETYGVYLSAKAAALVEDGDTLSWGDYGRSDWTYQGSCGRIKKPSGQNICLIGSRDLGIDTGHPPHLRLEYEQTWKIEWEPTIQSHPGFVIQYKTTEEMFLIKQLERLYEAKTVESAVSQWGATPFDLSMLPKLVAPLKWVPQTRGTESDEWYAPLVFTQSKPVLRRADSDVVRIVSASR